ncbi:hypothetical protein CLV35_0254 [Motilibacter peucedani]|uniref:Uncharacterized protein n=1 Tax=Motilibacter peucedani TaxID=598650 RepID=A0A420XV04_9ACTN|nr:hypothetical protein [Motilibacter peucedani]RKS80664.1 hypothetical protein CLV35_0254 [Motilibacter peucedani]
MSVFDRVLRGFAAVALVVAGVFAALAGDWPGSVFYAVLLTWGVVMTVRQLRRRDLER